MSLRETRPHAPLLVVIGVFAVCGLDDFFVTSISSPMRRTAA